MIKYVTRKALNEDKYDNCIQNSLNSRVYAFSWYLDAVADNWDALVLNDYEAVMPLPWRQKFFIKYVYPPAWTQQLGVFSKNTISEALILEFIEKIPKKFKKITIQFNSGNKFYHKSSTKRVNYILKLNTSYESLIKGLTKNRIRDINKATKKEARIDENVSKDEFFNFYAKNANKHQISVLQKEKLNGLLNSNKGKLIGARINNELVAVLFYFVHTNRITYLVPIATLRSKRDGIPTFLIVYILKKFQNTDYIFDFEGSMLIGVADFYKSFGARIEHYYLFKKSFNF